MKTRVILVGLVTTLILPAALSAAEVHGFIASVDLKTGELVLDKVRPRLPNLTLVIDDKTQVLFGKQPGTLKELPLGRRADVEFEERDGRRFATAIHVHGRAPVVEKAVTDSSTVSGILRRVALTDREIVVVGPGAKGPQTETTIAIPESVRVTRDGKAIAFDALMEDETVTVSVEKRDGRLCAITVQIGVSVPTPKESNVVPRLRILLRIADGILQRMEDQK